VFFVVGFCWC